MCMGIFALYSAYFCMVWSRLVELSVYIKAEGVQDGARGGPGHRWHTHRVPGGMRAHRHAQAHMTGGALGTGVSTEAKAIRCSERANLA